MNETEYDRFYNALVEADTIDAHAFEQAHFFEGCMPIEVMARRGRDTLCFGPMKPVGLIDPRSGRRPYAVVQLRAENLAKTAYNIVGFQTRLRQGEQKRVFSMIPGLHRAEFLRYGSIHRNTFINAPLYLNPDLTLKSHPAIFLAGQITGVEGYIESAAMGFLAGVHRARQLCSLPFLPVPAQSAHGALIRHLTESDPCHFQPSNIHFGLFTNTDMIPKIKDKKKRRIMIAETALTAWQSFVETLRKDCP
jgi:methylenetetrahydrofolate--tRNA-(uracil-5-)-methyltransferase